MVLLKSLNKSWRTREMPFINSEINLTLTCYCSANCFIISDLTANQISTFTTSDKELHVPVATLPTQR